jgi:hypothetical protein
LSTAIAKEKLVLGDKYDRRHVIETLGACGILETPEHPGFTTRWTTFASRQDRPDPRVECDPPIAFWTAAHGVSSKNVASWFGHLGVKVPKASEPRAAAVAKKTASMKKAAKRSARVTELEVGDAVGFSVGRRWIAGVVIDHHTDRGGTTPIMELVDWQGAAFPTASAIRGKRARGTEPMMLALFVRDDPRGRWHFIGSGFPKPSAKHLEDPYDGGFSVESVDNLRQIAKSAGLA